MVTIERDYYVIYDELYELSLKLKPFYDIDKVKPYAVYVWTMGSDGYNVFDILEDKLVMYDIFNNKQHKIKTEVLPIIDKIQLKIKELRNTKL